MATFRASVEAWRSLVRERADSNMPIDALMAWLDHESGGNPCSTGIILPSRIVEAGIAQTYHPDDDRFGATSSQLRASCNSRPFTDEEKRVLAIPASRRTAAEKDTITRLVRFLQTPARQLTSDERELQVRVFLNYVRAKMSAARSQLADAGANWPETSFDFWSLVKLQHALPGLPKLFLPAVTKKLGRAPASWKEFRSTVDAMSSVEVRAVSSVVAQWHPFDRLWNNAERVGKHAGSALAGGPNVIAILLGLVGLGWLFSR